MISSRYNEPTLSEVYKLSPHENFPQRTLEKLLSENKLYSIQKYTKSTLDVELDYGFIGPKEGTNSTHSTNTNISTTSSLIKMFQDVVKENSEQFDKKLNEELRKKDKEISDYKKKAEKELSDYRKKMEKKLESVNQQLKKKDKELVEYKKKKEKNLDSVKE